MALVYLNEDVLIKSIKAGDNEALQYVYKTHYPMIKNFILLNNGSEDDAEDRCQETIISVYENICSGKYEKKANASLKTYIYSVNRLQWLNELRKRSHSPVTFTDSEEYFTDVEPEEETESLPYDEMVKEAMNQLGEKCREMLLGFYYARMTMEMIAEKMKFANANVAKASKERCMKEARRIADEILRKHC